MAKRSGRQQSKNRTQRQRTRRQGARAQKQRTQRQRSQRQRTQGQRNQGQRKQRRTRKRPLNPFMQKLNTARESGAKSFDYNGNTYNRKMLKTGMVVYKSA